MSSSSFTVLLVDDEDQIRQLLAEELIDNDINVIQSDNGRDALKLFEENEVHLVLSDIKMPFISGPELAEKVWKKNSDIPVFFITAYKDEITDENFNHGVRGVIAKPFDIDEIVQLILKYR